MSQAQEAVPRDTPIGHLESVATFNGPMPTGVTVSRTNCIFVNFPQWGDDVRFTVAEVVHGRKRSPIQMPYALFRVKVDAKPVRLQ
jgi:hypothetical protein